MIDFVIFVSSRAFKVNIPHQSQDGAGLTIASFSSLYRELVSPSQLIGN